MFVEGDERCARIEEWEIAAKESALVRGNEDRCGFTTLATVLGADQSSPWGGDTGW
jgi:hypothetical protein